MRGSTALRAKGVTNSYDGFGLGPLSSTNNLDGTSRRLEYGYDLNGNRIKLTYPDQIGTTAYFAYDVDGLTG